MSTPKRYKCRMKAAIHETTEGLYLGGLVSEKRMAACDNLCLTKVGKATVLARRQRRRAKATAGAKKNHEPRTREG